MKVFNIGDVYDDTFDVVGKDGAWGELQFEESWDGIYVMPTHDFTQLTLLSDDTNDDYYYIPNYGDAQKFKGKYYIHINLNKDDGFWDEGKFYKVVVFGMVGNESEGWTRLNGTTVREFAIAPYGANVSEGHLPDNFQGLEISSDGQVVASSVESTVNANVVSVNGMAVEGGDDPVGKIDAIHQRIVGTTEIDFDTDPSTMIITYDGSTSFVYEIFTGADGDEKVTGPDDVITKMVLVTEPS